MTEKTTTQIGIAVICTLLMLIAPVASVSGVTHDATTGSEVPHRTSIGGGVDNTSDLVGKSEPIGDKTKDTHESEGTTTNSTDKQTETSNTTDSVYPSNLSMSTTSKSSVNLRNSGAEPPAYSANANTASNKVVVILEIPPSDSRPKHIAVLRKEGASIQQQHENHIQAKINVSDVAEYEELSFVHSIRKPKIPQTSAVSEGVQVIKADQLHNAGVTGKNVKVGVLAVTGFDRSNNDINANIANSRSFSSAGIRNNGNYQHGTGVAEIVVDVAPDSDLYLSNFDTEVGYANAVSWMRQQGVDVIVMSASYYNEPHDGTGFISRQAEQAVSDGIVWTNSAGNAAGNHWNGSYNDQDGDNWAEFENGDEVNMLRNGQQMQRGELAWSVLKWDEWPEADQDYDLYLVRWDNSRNQWVKEASSTRIQDGNDEPYEIIYTGIPQDGVYGFAIWNDGADGTQELEMFFPDMRTPEFNSRASSVTAPAAAPNTLSVGAFNWDTGNMEDFSSEGPTNDGRLGVDVVAPDAVSINSYSSFYGTSAAAPHVAGVAALLTAKDSRITPTTVENLLESTATDIGPTGADYQTGYGKVDAKAAAAQVGGTSINVDVTQIGATRFPTVDVYTSVRDGTGSAITGLGKSNFSIAENGTTESIESVTELSKSGTDISTAIVIDRSGSMGGGKLSSAKTAAKTFVDRLRPSDEAAIISFGGNVQIDQRWTNDKTELRNAVDSLSSNGRSPLYDGAMEGIREAAPRSGRSAVIVLADGQNDYTSSIQNINRVIQEAQQKNVPVYTIGLGSSVDKSKLKRLADETGGEYYKTPSVSELDDIYQNISQRISTEYKLTYSTSNPSADGSKRVVNIQAVDAGLTGSDTGTYRAPSSEPPVPSFDYTVSGQTVTFDARNSFDSDGSIVRYEWDFDNDGQVDDTGVTTTHTYATNDTYEARLTVEDDSGVRNYTVRRIAVGTQVKADIVFSIDDSGSMSGEIATVKQELSQFATTIKNSGVDPRFALITFAESVDLRQGYTRDVARTKTAINSITVGGGTEWNYRAIELAANGSLNERSDARTIVIDLTDEDTDRTSDDPTQQDLVNLLDRRNVAYIAVSPDDTGRLEKKTIANNVEDGEWFDIATVNLSAKLTKEIPSFITKQARSPIARFTSSTSGLTVTADATGSSDPDGSITLYEWDFDGDGTVDATGPTASYTYSSRGTYDLQLTVTDNDGQTDSTASQITVGNNASGLNTAVSVRPSTNTTGVSSLTAYRVVAKSADDGIGGFNLSVAVSDPSVAEIVSAKIPNSTYSETVDISSDDSSVQLDAVGMQTNPGTVTLAEITLRGTAQGTTSVVPNIAEVFTAQGQLYSITSENSGLLTIQSLAPINNYPSPPTDPDSDSLYEDITGDGQFSLVDVQGFLVYHPTDPTIQNNQNYFDFNNDGGISLADVQALLAEYRRTGGYTNEPPEERSSQSTVSLETSSSKPNAGSTTVSALATNTTLQTGQQTSVPIQVDNATDDVGGFNLTITASNASVVEIVSANITHSSFNETVSIAPDGSSVNVEALGMRTGTGSPTIVNVTVVAQNGGTATLNPSVTELFDRNGQLYTVTAENPASFTVTANTPPVASFTRSPAIATVGDSVQFNGTNSSDPDGAVVSYEWDFNNDGVVEATGPTPSHTFNQSGRYQVALTVTDDDGASDTTTRSLLVPEATNTTATVVLSNATTGFRQYNLTLTADGGLARQISPKLITGRQFQRVSGGVAESSVTVRAVDLVDSVQGFRGEKSLFTVTFAGNLTKSDISVAVHTLVDDNGSTLSPRKVTLSVGTIFESPIGVGQAPPADPDNDGKFEDVNGDGKTDFDDAVALSFVDSSQLTSAQTDALDFDNDGDVDFNDAVELSFQT